MKGLNFKSLFLDHLEKIGFGFIALLVVTIWASEYFGGKWSPERRDPDQMISESKTKKTEIDGSKWPEEKRQQFQLEDFSERAATLLRPINTSRYELSTEFFVPLNRPKEKAREPEFLAVESLDAQQGHVILAVGGEEDEEGVDDEDAAMAQNDAEMEEEDDENVRRDTAVVINDALEEPVEDKFKPKKSRKRANVVDGYGAVKHGGDAVGGQAKIGHAKIGGGGGGGFELRTIEGQRAQGRFYVAVRGVWPIRQQLEKIQKALHLPTTSAAMDFLEIVDFQLERQVAAAGDNPWSKEWEKLDIQYAEQILDEVDGFDDEPTDMQVFDTVITMPLPMRVFGIWKDHALHPRIQKYVLTPEEQQREKALRERLSEEFEKFKLEEEKQKSDQRKGFASKSHDVRQNANMMMRNNPGAATQTFREMASDMRGTTGGPNLTQADLAAKVTAVGRLQLFRYFDFDVQPGYAYRYRVKLILRNPNFDRPVSEVIDPPVAEGKFRDTPVSNVSNVAVLPITPNYFLKDVDKNPLADDGKVRKQGVASISIYDWHRDLGTQVASTLSLKSLGQFLGAEEETTILDVVEPSLDKGKYQFMTDDILLDLTGDADVVPKDHPDLALPELRKGSKNMELKLAPEAVVINGGGELQILEANGESAEEKALRLQVDRERRPFRNAKKKEETTSNPLDLLGAGKGNAAQGAKGAGPMPGGPAGKAEAKGDPRRKKGGKSAGPATGNAAAGAMPTMDPSMRPGMAGAAAAGNAKGKSKGKSK